MTSITLEYITGTTDTDTIVIKDASFKWVQEYYPEAVSIGGQRRNDTRGFSPVLVLEFEHDIQLVSVFNKILSTILDDGVIRYSTSDGVLPMYPENAIYINDFKNQIKRKSSTLVLTGNIQDDMNFYITGILCGSTDVTCGQTDILCGA